MSDDTSTNAARIDAEEILEGILRWVRIESPSNDGAAVNRMVDATEADLRAIDATIERVPGREGFGDILLAHAPWNDANEEPGILVVSHLDTVHPIGTIEDELTVRREGDRVYGPGIYDMKGGAYLAYYAVRHLVRNGERAPLPVTFLFVPEEEVGSPTSRERIEAEALRHKYVLVTEPARDGGKIVTARKGSARYAIEVHGRPAHSGMRHQDGRSAIREMAHQILALERMTDYERGVTVNVGLISGGTGTNVVPARCAIEVDARVPDPEAGEAICARIEGLEPIGPDTRIEITGGMNRPPFRMNEGIESLFEHARGCAETAGFELEHVELTGGGSDGNFTAALGVPTLDGLGVDGHGAHTDYEHLYYSSLEPRTRMWVELLRSLR